MSNHILWRKFYTRTIKNVTADEAALVAVNVHPESVNNFIYSLEGDNLFLALTVKEALITAAIEGCELLKITSITYSYTQYFGDIDDAIEPEEKSYTFEGDDIPRKLAERGEPDFISFEAPGVWEWLRAFFPELLQEQRASLGTISELHAEEHGKKGGRNEAVKARHAEKREMRIIAAKRAQELRQHECTNAARWAANMLDLEAQVFDGGVAGIEQGTLTGFIRKSVASGHLQYSEKKILPND